MKKKLIFVSTILSLSLLFWYFAKPWVYNPARLSDVWLWLVPLVVMLLLVASTALVFVMIKGIKWRLSIAALVGLPAFLFFGFHWLIFTGFGILIVVYWYAIKIVDTENHERTKINIRSTTHRAAKSIIFPILIIVSFAYYLTPVVQESSKHQEVPLSFIKIINKTIDTVFQAELTKLPPAQQRQAKSEVSNQVIATFKSITKPYARYFPPLLAFGIFILLEGLSFIFVWISTLLATGIFRLLRRFNFVTVVKKQVEAEVIETI